MHHNRCINGVPRVLENPSQDKETYHQVTDQEKEKTNITPTSITVKNVDIESPEKNWAKIALLTLVLRADS